MVNIEIDENKTKENIFQNSLTMYSIYILSKYYDTCDKIGISKISIYDKNKNLIPIEYSNTNEGLNINYLFNMNSQGNELNHFPLVTLFKDNFCINFYIKNINNSFLDYIYIYNYSNLNKGISPVKEIKIFKTNILLYKGCLNENNINIIKISDYINKEENKENEYGYEYNNDLECNEKYNIIKNNEKSLTFNIFKSLINENIDTNDNNFKINRFNSARNTFHMNRYSEDTNTKNINNNNFNENNNNISINNNENGNPENILFFQTNNANNNYLLNSYKDLSKTNISHLNYYDNDFNLNFQNENETNFSKTLKLPNYSNKLFLNSYNSAFDDVDNLFRTSIGYINKPEDSDNYNINENNNNNNFENNNNCENPLNINIENKYENNLNINNDYKCENNINVNDNDYNNNNYFFNNNDIDKNYIEFNKINIFLKSNYGHRKYIGLTGIIFIDENNEKIEIEKAQRIGALPKDLRTIYNDDSDNRIFENVFNGINNTNDPDNMWVTRLKKNETAPYLELYFEEKIKLSKIIIYNYNQKDKLEIGTKSIDLYLDDYYYKTISLMQGTGDIANIKNDINNSIDFGQEICFDNEYENCDTINKLCSTTGLTLYNKEENTSLKYASNLFDQCYETPYLPSGNFIKFQFNSYYFDKNNQNTKENDFYLGINNIEVFNEDGINILNNNQENNKFNYRIISNKEINKNNEEETQNNIFIKGNYIEDDNQNKFFDKENNLFYLFDKLIQISYIKITPIDNNINNYDNKNVYKIKEIKIFCEDKIIFEGEIYKNKPTIILFTCENKLIKDINKNFLTKYINRRKVEEIQTNNYCSLILN